MDALTKFLSFLNPAKNATYVQALGSVLVVLSTLAAIVKAVMAVLSQTPIAQ